jgi:hypothetical protein
VLLCFPPPHLYPTHSQRHVLDVASYRTRATFESRKLADSRERGWLWMAAVFIRLAVSCGTVKCRETITIVYILRPRRGVWQMLPTIPQNEILFHEAVFHSSAQLVQRQAEQMTVLPALERLNLLRVRNDVCIWAVDVLKPEKRTHYPPLSNFETRETRNPITSCLPSGFTCELRSQASTCLTWWSV